METRPGEHKQNTIIKRQVHAPETSTPYSYLPQASPPTPETRLAVSPAEAARLAGVGRTTLYAALGSGKLASFKIGKRRLITVDALRNWLRSHGATL